MKRDEAYQYAREFKNEILNQLRKLDFTVENNEGYNLVKVTDNQKPGYGLKFYLTLAVKSSRGYRYVDSDSRTDWTAKLKYEAATLDFVPTKAGPKSVYDSSYGDRPSYWQIPAADRYEQRCREKAEEIAKQLRARLNYWIESNRRANRLARSKKLVAMLKPKLAGIEGVYLCEQGQEWNQVGVRMQPRTVNLPAERLAEFVQWHQEFAAEFGDALVLEVKLMSGSPNLSPQRLEKFCQWYRDLMAEFPEALPPSKAEGKAA